MVSAILSSSEHPCPGPRAACLLLQREHPLLRGLLELSGMESGDLGPTLGPLLPTPGQGTPGLQQGAWALLDGLRLFQW